MSALDAIAVQAEYETGNVGPLLHEIRHALARLVKGGEGTVIDMRSLPLAPGEEKRIEEALGEGELRADLDALGPTTIIESRFPGVWLITHKNADGAVVARIIEVSRIPDILMSQREDIEHGIDKLESELQA